MTADRIYSALLRLYPKPFREEYGSEMLSAFRDMRQARRSVLVSHQRLEPGRVFGLRHELPAPGDASQPIAASGLLVLPGQPFERLRQFVLFDFLQSARGFIAFGLFGRGGKDLTQFLGAQWLLRRKEQGF